MDTYQLKADYQKITARIGYYRKAYRKLIFSIRIVLLIIRLKYYL